MPLKSLQGVEAAVARGTDRCRARIRTAGTGLAFGRSAMRHVLAALAMILGLIPAACGDGVREGAHAPVSIAGECGGPAPVWSR